MDVSYSRQLDAHKHAACEERHHDTEKPKGHQHDPVEPSETSEVATFQYNEPQTTQDKQKTRHQTFHDVLTVDTILEGKI